METVSHPWVTDGNGKLRFGFILPGGGDWSQQRDLAQALDDLGYDSAWQGDHPAMGSDCWTMLAAYAGCTRRVRLVSLSCVYYRSPQMLARQAADVDRLSNGRLVLGLGAGWAAGEFGFLGRPYPPVAERLRYLEETIKTIRSLWNSPPTVPMVIDGTDIGGPYNVGSVQQPYIPLLIAGAGEKVILRQVAEYADMCNIEQIKAPTPDDLHRKFEALHSYCETRGRPYTSVIRSHFLNCIAFAETPSTLADVVNALPPFYRDFWAFHACTPRDLVALYRPLIDAGAQYLVFAPVLQTDVGTARLFAEQVMPELEDYFASVNG